MEEVFLLPIAVLQLDFLRLRVKSQTNLKKTVSWACRQLGLGEPLPLDLGLGLGMPLLLDLGLSLGLGQGGPLLLELGLGQVGALPLDLILHRGGPQPWGDLGQADSYQDEDRHQTKMRTRPYWVVVWDPIEMGLLILDNRA